MIGNLLSKYIWLTKTIYSADNGITFAEINQKWLDNDLSEGIDLSKRTFHKWRIAIEELFGLIIECERKNEYRFIIQNKEQLKQNDLTGWLFNTLSISCNLQQYKSIQSKILLEDVFTDRELIFSILDAIRTQKTLHITYQSFFRNNAISFEATPYCVKMFRQRWYLVAKSSGYDHPRVYALDRIIDLKITENTYKYPENFSPEAYFSSFYGIIVDKTMDAEYVDIKVHHSQVGYLHSLPLHPSQQEVEQTNEYSIFRLFIAPTFDFEQYILSMGEYIEVISPEWFRQRLINRINKVISIYK